MKLRVLTVAFAFLFAIIFTVGNYAQVPNSDKENMDKSMPKMGEKFFEKLNLTDAQKDQISKLRTDFQKKMVDLRANLQKDMINLKSLRSKDDLTRSEVIAQVESVNKDRNAIALATANHLMDIREILTPEQKKIAKDHLPGMMWKMREGGFNKGFHKKPGLGRMNPPGGMMRNNF